MATDGATIESGGGIRIPHLRAPFTPRDLFRTEDWFFPHLTEHMANQYKTEWLPPFLIDWIRLFC